MPTPKNGNRNTLHSEKENERLQTLRDFSIWDADMQDELEGLISLASEICETPISLINLIDSDTQLTKANLGWNLGKIARTSSFCQYTIEDDALMIVEDASKDERFKDNPYVKEDPRIRFYAGMPLKNDTGYNIGALCVIDKKPRQLTKVQKKSLRTLGKEVMARFNLIKKKKELQQRNKEKEVLLAEVHHRVKNNLAVISGLLELESNQTELPASRKALQHSQMRIQSMAMVHEMLYKTKEFTNLPLKPFIAKIVQSIKMTYHQKEKEIGVKYHTDPITLNVNQAIPCALIINELITNAYQHAFKNADKGCIQIKLSAQKDILTLTIEDDGDGLAAEFSIQEQKSMGFTLIRTLCKQLRAELSVESVSGTKTVIIFRKEDEKGSSNTILRT